MRLFILSLLLVLSQFEAKSQCTTVYTAPYYESFDASSPPWIQSSFDSYYGTLYWGNIDSCWQRASGNYRFVPGPIYDPYSGVEFPPLTKTGSGLNMTVYLNGSQTNSPTFLTSPKIDISSMANPQIEVWTFMTYDTNWFYIQAKDYNASAWTTLDVVHTTTPSYSNAQWEAQTVPIPTSLGDTIRVRFLFDEVSSSLVALDDFSIKEDSTCLGPLNVGFSNITKHNAIVSWADSTSIHWNMEYGVKGFALGQGTQIDSIMSAAYLFSGLSAGTKYSVYLQGVCDSTNATALKGPYTFQTLCDTIQSSFVDSAHFLHVDFDASGSSGNSLTYDWQFGDGNAATGSNVNHQYAANGNYSVLLVVEDACGQIDSATKALTICDSLVVDFGYNQNASAVTVFVDTSISTSQLTWHFGDGTTMNGDTISHTYASEGTYLVTLVAQNICGDIDSISKTINACTTPQAVFTYTVVDSTVTYMADTALGTTQFYWLFGDGTSDSGAVVQHVFNLQTGQPPFQTTLIALNACNQSDTASASIPITFGLAELNVKGLDVYPNPSSTIFNIVLPQNVSVDFELLLFDVIGKKIEIRSEIAGDRIRLDLSDLPSGEYTIKLQTSKVIYAEKVILKH